jgi:origin recognition complex subunit 3
VLLFGVATSTDLFHEKLPKAAIQLMQGAKFDVTADDELFDEIFRASLTKKSSLFLGPNLCDVMVARQTEQVQSVQGYINGLKVSIWHNSLLIPQYAYMSHFFANPLSVLLTHQAESLLQDEHLQAIRHLQSFRA